MAKKKTASGGMNRTERVAGTIFFLVYLLVMPLLATRIFDLLEVVLDTTINDSLRIADEGKAMRAKAEEEIKVMEGELREALIAAKAKADSPRQGA